MKPSKGKRGQPGILFHVKKEKMKRDLERQVEKR